MKNEMKNMEEALLGSREQCAGCNCIPRDEDGLPVRNLVLIGTIMLCNALPISVLFPYIYFLVRDFHVSNTEKDIGFYAGWVGASFMVGRCCTGIFWGVIADRFGRKFVMFAGISSVLVFNTLFGFSTKFWMAIVFRFCLGSMNGMVGTIQAVATELSSKKYQSLGLGVVSTMWGFGLVVGPAIGGYLAQPAMKYPNIFSGSLFARFPYLLPPLCISIFALLGLLACFLLPETFHNHPTYRKDGTQKTGKLSILSNKAYMFSILLFAFCSLHDIAYTEIFSLWAVRPRDEGGLDFSSSDIGKVLAVAGCGMLVSQLGLFPPVTRRLGSVLVCRIAAVLSLPLIFMYLFMPMLDGSWLWTILLLVSTFKYVLVEAISTSLMILINNSVRQEERGTANGISMSLFSLFKAIGPAAGGSIFAWSQKRFDASFLPGNQFVFTFLAFWILLVAIGTFIPCIRF